MRIVRLANFWTPSSGGQRIALDEVGRRYRERGHEPVLVVPGASHGDAVGPSGRIVTLAGRRLPGTPYRLLTDVDRVIEVLGRLRPDRIELSDRATLWPVLRWAEAAGVPAVLWAHERVDAILAPRVPAVVPLGRAARLWNRRTLRRLTRAVAPSSFVAEELTAAGVPDVRVVPHGVDLDLFHPGHRPPPSTRGPRLVWVGRLSGEKRPEVAVAALEALVARGHGARLMIVGDGPAGPALRRRAQGLPVTFAGHLANRSALSHLLAAADVALATCPCESFGLAALEALACGTPVVASRSGALRELVDPTAGRLSDDRPEGVADAVEDLLAVPAEVRVGLARRRAERYSWEATVDGLLLAHDATTGRSHRGQVPA